MMEWDLSGNQSSTAPTLLAPAPQTKEERRRVKNNETKLLPT